MIQFKTKKAAIVLYVIIIITTLTSFIAISPMHSKAIFSGGMGDSILKAPKGITARKVANNYIEALGGKKKIGKLKRLVIVEKKRLEAMDLEIIRYKMPPNKYTKTMKAGYLVLEHQIFDGRNAFIVNLEGSKILKKGEQLNRIKMNAIFSPLTYISKKRYKLMGIQIVNNKKMYVMESKYPVESYDYFNVNSGLLVRRIEHIKENDSLSTQVTTDFYDYQPSNGILFPRKYTSAYKTEKITMFVDSIYINRKAKFPTDIFIVP